MDLSKTVLVHGDFQEGQLTGLIEQAMDRSSADIGIIEVIRGARCSKVVCNRKEDAANLAAGIRQQQIPGQNNRFSCSFLP